MGMTIGSLFSGIGGLEIGLERAGMEVVWQVEKDEFCRKVLAKHWPDVTRYEDVKDVGAHNLEPVDLICGGFPCQDISYCGKGVGIEGERSGLWTEYARIIRELRPRFVLVENVPAILTRGMGRVLGDLAESGYDAQWDCLPASAFGAPHLRDRVFIVAYDPGLQLEEPLLGEASRLQRESRGVGRRIPPEHHWQTDQPSMVGMVYGDGGWPHVSRALGNAVVPQVSEYIGHRIMDSLRSDG